MGRVPPLSVRLSSEQLERVRGEAGRLGVSVNAFVVGAVLERLGSSGGSGVVVELVPPEPVGVFDEVVVRPLPPSSTEALVRETLRFGPSAPHGVTVDELVASGRVSRGVPKPRKSACPHRVPVGSFCKRCD